MDRKVKEQKIKAYAWAAIIVDFVSAVKTNRGNVTMLDRQANMFEDQGGDWIYKGSLQDLDDKSFNKVWEAVRRNAREILESAEEA